MEHFAHFEHLNYLAVLVSALVFFGLGWLWFSPSLFGCTYQKACCTRDHDTLRNDPLRNDTLKNDTLKNVKVEDAKNCCCGMSLVWGFLISLLFVVILAHFLRHTGAVTLGESAWVAFLAWLGFVATTLAGGVIWEKKPCCWWAVTSGYYLVGLLLSSVILTLWK